MLDAYGRVERCGQVCRVTVGKFRRDKFSPEAKLMRRAVVKMDFVSELACRTQWAHRDACNATLARPVTGLEHGAPL